MKHIGVLAAMKCLITLLILVLASPAYASTPGTPMDCSDFVLAPGYTCTEVAVVPVDMAPTDVLRLGRSYVNGVPIKVRVSTMATPGQCTWAVADQELTVEVFDPLLGSTDTVMTIAERCNPGTVDSFYEPGSTGIVTVEGNALVLMIYRWVKGHTAPYPPPPYEGSYQIVRIEGFGSEPPQGMGANDVQALIDAAFDAYVPPMRQRRLW